MKITINKTSLLSFFTGLLLGSILISIPWYIAWKSEVDQANARFFEKIIDAPEIIDLSLTDSLISLSEAELNWSFKNVDGKEVQLADFENKLVLINFWATWCVPCVAELPSLNELYKKYKDNDQVSFLFLTDESIGKIERFINKRADFKNLPFYSYTSEEKPTMFVSEGIPTTIIIDTKNDMILKHIGMAHWDSKNVIKLINDHLGEKR